MRERGIYMPGRKKFVFISYTFQDREFVEKLASDLASHGIRAWFAEKEIEIGDSWSSQIQKAIEEADAFLYILSRSSLKSRWVQEALKASSHTSIYFILIEKVRISGLPHGVTYFDLSESDSYQRGITQITSALLAGPSEKPTLADSINIENLAKNLATE